jgi:cell volume regulation protein A
VPPGLGAATEVFTLDDLAPTLLVGTLVLIVCVAAVRLSVTSGLPSLVLYLGVGLLLGEGGIGIQFNSNDLAQVLGYAALILILTEGGLTTQWSEIRNSVAPAVVLSTVGVVVSVAVVAVAVRFVLDFSWSTALLLGAILASTDAAAVFSVLRRVPLPRRVTGMLEAESGFNDAPVVLLVTALSVQAANPEEAETWWSLGMYAVLELAGGALIGLAVGWVGGWLMRRVASGSSGLFSIAVTSIAVLAYGVASTVHTSGFIACYLAALVLGNMKLPHRAAVRGFATAFGWLAQIGLFVMLGLLASPSGFVRQLGPALIIGLVLLLVARPLSVLVSLTPFRVRLREQVFLSWAGLRGAVPVVLATVPVTKGAPNVDWIFDLVFVLVGIFTVIQAPSLPWVARRLGVAERHRTMDLGVEATPLEEMHADLLQVTVGPTSELHGVEVFELRLPPGANVTLVVRDGKGFVPTSRTVLRHGDQLLIVATAATRSKAEKRVREISRHGRLATWRTGQGRRAPEESG